MTNHIQDRNTSAVDSDGKTISFCNITKEYFLNTEEIMQLKQRLMDMGILVAFRVFAAYQRIIAVFTSAEDAHRAKDALSGQKLSMGDAMSIQMDNYAKYCDPNQWLEPPEQHNLFLISPPASPPLGWTQVRESAPVRNELLLHRLEPFSLEPATLALGPPAANNISCLPASLPMFGSLLAPPSVTVLTAPALGDNEDDLPSIVVFDCDVQEERPRMPPPSSRRIPQTRMPNA